MFSQLSVFTIFLLLFPTTIFFCHTQLCSALTPGSGSVLRDHSWQSFKEITLCDAGIKPGMITSEDLSQPSPTFFFLQIWFNSNIRLNKLIETGLPIWFMLQNKNSFDKITTIYNSTQHAEVHRECEMSLRYHSLVSTAL